MINASYIYNMFNISAAALRLYDISTYTYVCTLCIDAVYAGLLIRCNFLHTTYLCL